MMDYMTACFGRVAEDLDQKLFMNNLLSYYQCITNSLEVPNINKVFFFQIYI